MQFTNFSPEATRRELLEFCKGRVPNYSKFARQGKAALLEHVNNWIAAENGDVLAIAESAIADCQDAIDRCDSLLADSLQELVSYDDPELSALAEDCLVQAKRVNDSLLALEKSCADEMDEPVTVEPEIVDRTAATVAAYLVAAVVIAIGTVLLWLLDIPILVVKAARLIHQLWVDLKLQWRYLEWPQWWLPAMQLASANR